MEIKDTFAYLEALGKKESSGRYYAKNHAGFIGMYQMGESALVDAGYYKPKKNGNYNNKWDGEFTGLDDVYSVDDFLNNIRAQENAIRIYHKKLWNYIKDVAENYDGKISPKDRNSTPSGKSNNSNGSSSDGKWVTINGNHVLIEK